MGDPCPPQITYAQFVAVYPEFSNVDVYPQATISTWWIPQAYQQLNVRRFAENMPMAAMLYVAHYLTLGERNAAVARAGGIPGEARGPTSNKSVDKVSVGYAADSSAIEGAGIWNSTNYGQQLYKMMQAAGSGPFYAPRGRRFFG